MINRRQFVVTCGCTALLAPLAGDALAKGPKPMISACGMNCATCGIYKAAHDPAVAKKEAARWRKRGHKDAKAEWFKCKGCHGPKELVWSGKCDIRECCIEKKGLANCSLCGKFPCGKITKFENDGHKHHKQAIGNLRKMRQTAAKKGK